MKNKLYLSLFAVVVSSAAVVTVIGINTGPDGQGINPNVWGGTVATVSDNAPDWSKIAQGDKPGMLGAANPSMYGKSPSTYAPSELENMLRQRAQSLNRLSSELVGLANSFSFFRKNEPEMFVQYFGSEDEKENLANMNMSTIKPLEENEDDSDNSGV